MWRLMFVLAALVAAAPPAFAGVLIQIGDQDGFGYGAAPGFIAANGGPANIGPGGMLERGDYLPDIDRDGFVRTDSHDNFDFRIPVEVANTSISIGPGVSNTGGTVGSKYTDISLARSYDADSMANRVLIGGNPITVLILGAGGPFPDASSNDLPNQPGFAFHFDADKSVYPTPTDIFFNLIFGDYDVVPASIRITRADGTTRTLNLTVQGAGDDGLVQAATATLAFSDVFTDAGAVWRGSLLVDFVAPNEPYTSFDYVELSTIPLVAVPEPGSIALLGVGITGLALGWRRRRVGQ